MPFRLARIADPLLSTAVKVGVTSPPGNAKPSASVFSDCNDRVVLLDQADGPARHLNRLHQLPQRILHQHDMRRFMRHLGAVAHRDADIGIGQRDGVVDAVADHGDDLALATQRR